MGRCRDQVASLGRTESWREINHRLSCIRMPRSHRRVSSRTYAHSPKRECRRASSIHRLRQHVHAQETNGGSEHGGPRQRQSLRSAQITDRIHAFHERASSLCFYYSSALRSYRRARFVRRPCIACMGRWAARRYDDGQHLLITACLRAHACMPQRKAVCVPVPACDRRDLSVLLCSS
jgi:hypothetical protein